MLGKYYNHKCIQLYNEVTAFLQRKQIELIIYANGGETHLNVHALSLEHGNIS